MINRVMKEISCKQNVLKAPDGSADYSEGETNVIAAVYGPADCRESKQLIDRCAIEVSFRPKDGIPGVAERFLENTIKNICENVIITSLHPRSQIMVVVQTMQDHGSLLSCAINAVCMALQDAGVSMSCLPAGVLIAITERDQEEKNPHLGAVKREQEIVLYPSSKEEQRASATLLFVLDSVKKETICTICNGTIPSTIFSNCLAAARTACEGVFRFYRECITRKFAAVATGY